MAHLFEPIPFTLGIIHPRLIFQRAPTEIVRGHAPPSTVSGITIKQDWLPAETPETLRNEALNTARLLFFELKRRVCPGAIQPRSKTVIIPMSEPVWHLLLSDVSYDAKQRRNTKPLGFHDQVEKLYTAQVSALSWFNFLFPENWYLSFAGIHVAIHCAQIQFTFSRYNIIDHQSTLNLSSSPTLIPETIHRYDQTYCKVKFSYISTTRYHPSQRELIGDLPDLGHWRTQIAAVIRKVVKPKRTVQRRKPSSRAVVRRISRQSSPQRKKRQVSRKRVTTSFTQSEL